MLLCRVLKLLRLRRFLLMKKTRRDKREIENKINYFG